MQTLAGQAYSKSESSQLSSTAEFPQSRWSVRLRRRLRPIRLGF